MAQQVPRRNESGQPGRDAERGANRETEDDDSDGESGATPAARRGRRAPTNKLNMYMRAVAVFALLIVAGVGVYKGRNMLAPAETGPKIAKVKDDSKPATKPGESKPGAAKPASTKPAEPPKPGSFTPNSGSLSATAKNGAGKKPSALLSALNKEKGKTGSSPSVETKSTSDKKPGLSGYKFGGKKEEKPVAVRPPGSGGYSLNDNTSAESPEDGNTADPSATSNAGEYGSDEPAIVSDDDGYGSPGKPLERSGGYSLNDEPADSAEDGMVDPQAQDETYADREPVPPAPRYGSGGSGYTAPSESSGSTRPKTFSALGSPPKNSLADTPPDTIDDQQPPDDLPEKQPTRLLPEKTVPANRLLTGPLDRSRPLGDSSAAERYPPKNDDITPIPSPRTPVEANLTGLQTPSIAVEKFAPEEVQVGKSATFEIVVKNVGKVPAYDVTVQDEVPRGTRFRQATPQASQTQDGGLSWKLGVMQPGEEKVIELQLVPEMEGEIGSVAQVTFQSKAGSKSIVTQPRLEIRHEAPQQVHAGEIATVRLTITNSGTGAASNLVLASEVPAGFTHEAGSSLETKVNPLRPGESTQVNLVMKAVKAGQYQQSFSIEEEDGKVVAEDAAAMEVVAPGLQVAVAGPKKRYVERQATHNITIANPGTASAKDVDLVAYLPRGFKFVAAAPVEAGGQYDSRQHAVVWGLEELVAGASATVQLTTLPVESGDQKVRVEARSANGLTADFEQLVAVDAVSELPFTIHDLADPIEIGSETAYEIRLSNRGAKDATNVAISVAFPRDLKPIDGDGAAKATVSGDRVEFVPIGRITPGQEVVFKVRAEGLRAGDHRIAVSLTSDDQQQPLTREESTRVYSDQ